MLIIEKVPPPFEPAGRYTEERKVALAKAHPDFLWGEMELLHHCIMLHHNDFAWTDEERGQFKPEYFPPIDFPVIPHVPYIEKNIPIPPGIYDQVCSKIKRKVVAGVDGTYKTIPENLRIRTFVWEHFQNLNRIIQRMKYSGGTFSGHKLQLCVEKFWVIGHCCTFEGRIPDETRVSVIRNWGQCHLLSEV
jgi:hypothetical protein